MFDPFISFVREIYGNENVPLHRPLFSDEEENRVAKAIKSNFVSSAGQDIEVFEGEIANFTGARHAVATVNGTAALQVAMHVSNIGPGDEVITQAVSFVATANAISYCGAKPIFIDVDLDTLSMSPTALLDFLQNRVEINSGRAYNKNSGARIKACLPMHSFGQPARIAEISAICKQFNITLIEDCAESLGSFISDSHTGLFGRLAAISFNGNKIITTGGGGMIITNDDELAARAKHITTTAKCSHPYEYYHDELGFNYRMPNLNAALGLAQVAKLSDFLKIKRRLAISYQKFFQNTEFTFFWEREGVKSNFWLNSVICGNLETRNSFLEETNAAGIVTRPLWKLLNTLPMYMACETDALENSKWLAERLVNIPSSVPKI